MIEVFEKWFNQFTKPEQEKLLKHIRENHFDLSKGYSSKFSDKADKDLFASQMNSSRQKMSSTAK